MPSIFITGAAGGIGRAVAEKFLAAGWTVGAYDINPVTWSPDVHAGLIDVRDASSWDAALADFAAVAGGRIDVVDNNAGVIVDGPLAEYAAMPGCPWIAEAELMFTSVPPPRR